jgi:hypothetical protein
MTTREVFNRRLRWLWWVFLVAFLVFCLSCFFVKRVANDTEQFALGLLWIVSCAFVFFGRETLIHFGGYRCPQCEHNIGGKVIRKIAFSMDQRVKYCPFCGFDLDQQIED